MPPERPRIALVVAGRAVGSVEPDDARLLAREVADVFLDDHGLSLGDEALDDGGGSAGRDEASHALARMARVLRDAGRLGPWRDEVLPVLADDDAMLGVVERAAARALGLRTIAVHLLGWGADGRMWVQRRAPDKAVDPGLLDTLAGGMVAALGAPGDFRIEDLADAMRREADEEAGVPPDAPMRRLEERPLRIARPVAEGYMVEDLVGFEARLAAGFAPFNRDGEVAAFECLAPETLLERIGGGEFTLEASLLILERLRRGERAGS